MESHQEGLCASLPVEIRSLSLIYCHHHQAYRIYVSHTVQSSEEPEQLKHREVHFGPFDTYDEVVERFLDEARSIC